MTEQEKSPNAPAIAIIICEIVLAAIPIWWLGGNAAAWTSGGMLIIIVVLFTKFLFSIATDNLNRNLGIVVLFIFTSIGSMILLFGKIYVVIGLKDTAFQCPRPGLGAACKFLDAAYFSTVTWTTLGYGDIVPVPEARPVAAIEALTGYVVMGLLIAVLLAIVQQRAERFVQPIRRHTTSEERTQNRS